MERHAWIRWPSLARCDSREHGRGSITTNRGSDQWPCNKTLKPFPKPIAAQAAAKSALALDLSKIGLKELPESIGQLKRVQDLHLYDNQLSSLPESIGQLKQLQILFVYNNQLSSVPESIGQLKQLQQLYLSGNQLSSLPESIGQLTALKLLDLSNNQLTSLPPSLSNLSRLKELFLHSNSGLGIPPEVLGPYSAEVHSGTAPADPSAILRYYFQVRAGKRPLNEVKFILMGRGGVGKTSLVNRLVRNTFDPNSPKTEGIQITQWPVTVESDTVRFNVWDFGGQEIMHATHQFFLSERSVYLVVLSGREGSEDEDAEYWLKLAASFGAGSPVIVALNKMNEHRFDVNRRALRQKYPNIQEFVATDCETGLGIDALKNAVGTTLSSWKAWRVDFPAAWFEIKERLSGMPESFLSFEQFQEVCRDLGEPDAGAHAALAGYLHDLGIALNYKDDPRLRETHVLNPHWVTAGIYRILNAGILASRKGVLHFADLSDILPTDSYPRKVHMFLLDLMRKFELYFPFPDESDHYLVPELLDKQQPQEADEFSPATCLGFEYHYPILPEGLLPRFIVRSHVMSEGQPRWRSGVILQFEGCRALVKADVSDRRVQMLVDGPVGSRRRLLAVSRSDFDRIHASIPELKPKEMVPVPGRPEHLIDYRKLAILEQEGLDYYVEVIGDKVVKIPVSQLLDGVDLSRMPRRAEGHAMVDSPLKVFYSYAHKDDTLRNEMETHLKILERRGLISPWHDRLIRQGDQWAGEIDVNLEIADIILLLVSADFIASDYCYSKEMTLALEREKAGKARVIPVILRDCHWKGAPFGDFQGLPKDFKPVTLWPDRDSAWRDVSEGIERAIQSIREKR
jgi:internalin A